MKASLVSQQLRLFGMQNLMLESDLAALEASGIEIGHADAIRRDQVVDLELFDSDILQDARRMADFYVQYYALENTIRRLIRERLFDDHGASWWDDLVPQGVRDAVKDKQDKEKETVLASRAEDPLEFANFGELIAIIESNWSSFDDTIRSRKAMQQTLSQFNQIRNVIAHSCRLSENDIARMKLLIKDWLNIQT
jgi:energy-converting hydrogenase A subunit M